MARSADEKTGIINFDKLQKYVFNQLKDNIEQQPKLFFIEGDSLENIKIATVAKIWLNKRDELLSYIDIRCESNDVYSLSVVDRKN